MWMPSKLTPQGNAEQLASGRLGLASSAIDGFYDNFTNGAINWTAPAPVGTGTVQYPSGTIQGVTLDTGATANSVVTLIRGNIQTARYPTEMGGAGIKCWLGVRLKLPASDAATIATVEFINPATLATDVFLGFYGAVNATKFIVTDNNSGQTIQGLTTDAGYHTLEVAYDGIGASLYVDGVSYGYNAGVDILANSIRLSAKNGATASSRALGIKWIAAYSQKEAGA